MPNIATVLKDRLNKGFIDTYLNSSRNKISKTLDDLELLVYLLTYEGNVLIKLKLTVNINRYQVNVILFLKK